MPAKYKVLAQTLRQCIRSGVYDSSGSLPAEDKLAIQYGVSRETVRHALQLLAKENLIETRRGSGSHIVTQTAAREVAVVVSFQTEYIFPSIIEDIRSSLLANGYKAHIMETQNRAGSEREVLQNILNGDYAGVLMEGVRTALPNPNIDLYRKLEQNGMPMVFLFGKPIELADAPCVGDDNKGGGYMLTRYLIGMGHKNIAGVFKSDDWQGQQRYLGYALALRDSGLPLPDSCTLWYDTEDLQDLLNGSQPTFLDVFAKHRLDGSTAVVCYNDEIAYHLIRRLSGMNIDVPGRISVVGFDNSYYSERPPARITSLAHKSHCIGQMTVQALMVRMYGKTAESQQLPWTLIPKQSASPPTAQLYI